MSTSKKTKALKFGLATAVIGQAVVPVATVLAEEAPTNPGEQNLNIDLQITQDKNVDVVLTLGKSKIDATNFEADLNKKLSEKGLDTSRLNIQALEVEEANVQQQDQFDWMYYGHDIQDGWWPVGNKRITHSNEGRDLFFDGYKTKGYADFMFLKSSNPDKKTFTFQLDEKLNDYHAMEGAGFLFNTELDEKAGTIKGYAVIIGPQVRLYQIDTTISNFYNTSSSGLGGKAKLIASFNKVNTLNHNIKIEIDDGVVNMWDNGVHLINGYKLPSDYGSYGFGPIASHMSHNCMVRSQFTFKDLQMTTTVSKKFNEVIREPEWRSDTERFIVNLEDNIVPDFESPSDSGEILTRLMNENINYIALGTSTNKAQALNFIDRNDKNGLFIDNSNYDKSINEVADYILEVLNRKVKTVTAEDPYILTDAPLNIDVTPKELKSNTETEEYPNGRWKLVHNPSYFENDEGLSALATGYRSNLPTSFDKPGEYEIFFEDTHPNPRFVYAHRKPIADFSMTINKTAQGVNVTTVDNSYDPDHQSEANKGIVETKWQWKETTATEWNDGQLPANLPEGKNYLLQLQVKDVEGEWSLPVTTYVTTDKAVKTTPIANFTVSKDTLIIDHKLDVNDSSYDPAGGSLSKKQWKVFKNDNLKTPVYTGSSPVTDFSTYGVGKYTIELTVTNEDGTESDPFSRTVRVVEQEYIDALGNIDEISKSLEDINTEQGLNNLKELADSTEELINKLQEGTDKEHAKAEFEKINQNIEAATKVNELESKSNKLYNQQALSEAQALFDSIFPIVDGLQDGSVKNSLVERLGEIKSAIEKAESILINAELVNSKDVSLSWLPYEGADSYRVYLYQLNETTGEYERYSFARAANDGESLDITGLAPGHNYKFEVYPRVNGVAITDEPIGTVALDVPIPEVAPVAVVQNVKATPKDTEATVTWDALDEATRYRVQAYIKDPATGEFVKDGFGRTTTSNTIDMKFLDVGKVYKFEVIPSIANVYNEDGAGVSNEVTIQKVEESGPVVASTLNVSIDGTTAHLTWESIEDASRYRVQLYILDESGIFVKDGFAKSINETEATLDGLKEGAEYKFEVTPRIGYVYDTEFMITATAQTEKPEPEAEEPNEPGVNSNVMVTIDGTTANVAWEQIGDATRYRVQMYKKDTKTGKFEKYSFARSVTGTQVSFDRLPVGSEYQFEVIPLIGFYDTAKAIYGNAEVPAVEK